MINGILNIFRGAWQKCVNTWRLVYGMSGLLFDTVYAAVRKGRAPNLSLVSQVNRQILYTGVEAFTLVGAIAVLCGSAIVLVATLNMPLLGVGEYFGSILVIVVVGELGPFVTSLVVVGRSGSALAAYIGTMKVSREVDALEMMGIDPIQFIVQPALLGMALSVVCLNVYFIIIAVLGGLAVAALMTDMPFGIFYDKILEALTFGDVVFTLIKSVVFGLVVALMSSWCGLAVRNVRMIPIAALNSVVWSMFAVLALSLILSFAYYTMGN